MSLKIEKLESELPENLLPCPDCGSQPVIYRQEKFWKVTVCICCKTCNHDWSAFKGVLFPTNPDWKDSLYEAVAVWQTTAKILGSREKREESMSEHVARKFEAFQGAVLDDVIEGFEPH